MSTLIEKLKIEIDGNSYPDYNFLNIIWTQELLKPNELRFTIQKKDFLKTEDDVKFTFPKKLIGKKVSLNIETQRFDEMASLSNEKLEFEGIIFNIEVSRITSTSEILIDVIAFSPDYLLVDNKSCQSYLDKSLKNLVEETIDPYTFKKTIDPTFTTTIPYSVQYNETDYDYLVRLAHRYGEWLYYDGKEFVFGKLKKVQPPVELYARTDILSYKYSAKITHDNYKHFYADYLKYKGFFKTPDEAADTSVDGFIEFTKELKEQAKSLYTKKTIQELQCAIPEENEADELETSVKAQFEGDKAEISVCSGASVRADLCIGKLFKIKDLYDKDNNKSGFYDHEELIICKITHRAENNGFYKNEFTAISSKSKFPPYYDSDVYPVSTVQWGKVADNKDPEKIGRVRVKLTWQDDEEMTPWIRISQPHGGLDKGFYFIPEIEEAVMVGFVNGNAENPYVIGTFYNGDERPDSNWPNDNNDIKSIRTRNGHTVEIHDEGDDGFIRIYDNKKENYILTFSTDDKLIKLESTGNIELHAESDVIINAGGNISMKAGKNIIEEADRDIKQKAQGNISEEAQGNIENKATAKMSIKAATVDIKSDGPATLKGATVDASADGPMTIKGAVVNIN